MSNAAAFAALDAQIQALRSLERTAEEIAPEVAKELEAQIQAQIAAGTDPEGNPWPPAKEGGSPPLRTAGKALRVVSLGSRVIATLTGHVALHHLGRARGGVRRVILPTRKLPQKAAEAIKNVFLRHMAAKFGGK